jgi:hypothetical protein
MVARFRISAAVGIALAVSASAGAWAQGSTKEMSENSVQILMNYAWSILPARFTSPSGKVIVVDKQHKYNETVVPMDVAREVIKVGYMSAQAQLCDLVDEQGVNYDAMMRKEIAKKTWSDQQLLYITTLHRMTIHMAAGKLRVAEKDGESQVFLEPIEPSKDTCTDEKRGKVKEAITAYAKTIADAYPAPSAPAKAAPSQPVPAAQKK